MNKKLVFTLVKKDVRSILSSKKIWVLLAIETILMCLFLPVFVVYTGIFSDLFSAADGKLLTYFELFRPYLPENLQREINGYSSSEQLLFLAVQFGFILLFLISSVYTSSMIAANSFAGEKERKTLENLLLSPIKPLELFFGKTLATFIPTFLATFLSYIFCVIIVNVMAYSTFHQFLMLSPTWLMSLFVIIPGFVLFTILLNIVISAKVNSYIAAQQLGGLVILLCIGVFLRKLVFLLLLNPLTIFFVGVGMLLVDVVLLILISKWNKKDRLFENQIK